jgi:hypothetical protein
MSACTQTCSKLFWPTWPSGARMGVIFIERVEVWVRSTAYTDDPIRVHRLRQTAA